MLNVVIFDNLCQIVMYLMFFMFFSFIMEYSYVGILDFKPISPHKCSAIFSICNIPTLCRDIFWRILWKKHYQVFVLAFSSKEF